MKNSSYDKYISRIVKALQHVQNHIDQPINLKDLAQKACFSEFHFHRLFTSIVGETPKLFLNRVRLDKAANMMFNSPTRSLTEIAQACGFSSSSAFSRSFKERFQMTASQWREQKNSKIREMASNNWQSLAEMNRYIDQSLLKAKYKDLNMELELKTMPTLHLACVINLDGYFKDKIEQAWERLLKWARPRQLFAESTLALGVPLDNPDITPLHKCRYYACITVPKGTDTTNGVDLMEIAGGTYAVYPYKGSYQDIGLCYVKLYAEWLPNSGYEPRNEPGYEIYTHFDELQDNIDNQVQMEICIPVKPMQ